MVLQETLTISEPQPPKKVGTLRQILSLWKTWVILFTPFVIIALPLEWNTDAGKCAYVILIMAVYWMTEAIPMAVTALIPIALMPWLGVISSKQLCANYLKDTNMLFVGGLLVAVAVEKWNLHKRIALGVLLFVGSKPKWLMFGFMATTAFLSMWLSNTATTAMMIPIAQAVLSELDAHRKNQRTSKDSDEDYCRLPTGAVVTSGGVTLGVQDTNMDLSTTTLDTNVSVVNGHTLEEGLHANQPGVQGTPMSSEEKKDNFGREKPLDPKVIATYEKEDKAFAELSKGLTLCVAYAANIGGTATLTGTGPNLILKGQVDTLYDGKAGINFSSWFIFAFPNMVISLLLAWAWLQLLFLGPKTLLPCYNRKQQDSTANQVIKREYAKLGPWAWAEVSTLIFFILLALLWFTREPDFMPGWAGFFKDGYVTDSSVAITIGVMLFMFPAYKPNILCFRSPSETSKPGPVAALLDWPTVHTKMPWNVILVLGGGFALADACKTSGLSDSIGQAFGNFADFQPWIMVLLLVTITAIFTEVTSNTATATIFLPILAKLAEVMGVNPLYLMLPVTVATSLAFMLPVATPPNAMVFAYGHMKIIDMVKAGAVMNIVCIGCLLLATNTWGTAFFHLDTFPDWALPDNTTIATTLAPVLNCSTI